MAGMAVNLDGIAERKGKVDAKRRYIVSVSLDSEIWLSSKVYPTHQEALDAVYNYITREHMTGHEVRTALEHRREYYPDKDNSTTELIKYMCRWQADERDVKMGWKVQEIDE